MNDILPIILTVALVVLTTMLVVVGVLVVQVLLKVKATLERANMAIDLIEEKVNAVVSPLQNLGGMAGNLTTGFKIFESFLGWVNRGKRE